MMNLVVTSDRSPVLQRRKHHFTKNGTDGAGCRGVIRRRKSCKMEEKVGKTQQRQAATSSRQADEKIFLFSVFSVREAFCVFLFRQHTPVHCSAYLFNSYSQSLLLVESGYRNGTFSSTTKLSSWRKRTPLFSSLSFFHVINGL